MQETKLSINEFSQTGIFIIKGLSPIDKNQFSIDNVFTLSKLAMGQVNCENVMISGTAELLGSLDRIKWDLKCYDHVRDIVTDKEGEFIRMCFKLNTQKFNQYPVVILKKYDLYLGEWVLLKLSSIHWSELTQLKAVAPKISTK